MSISLVDVRSFLVTLPHVSVHDSTEDLFFFRGDEQNFPFATIVTHDDPYDALSNLSRPDVFRLNFASDKETFAMLFPDFQTKAALTEANLDYQAIDVLFPHPVYGRMRWVSVINPGRVWSQCQELLVRAHQVRELRANSW
jgi:hypothetical protein